MTDFEINALFLSLKIGMLSTLLIIIPGIFMSWILAKKNFLGKTIIDSFIHLPLVIPPIGIGYILLIMFGKNSFLGNFLFQNFNINLSFSWVGAALACSIMSFPLMVRPIRVLMEAQDKKIDDAARILGASEFKIFLSITLPLAYPGILAGLVLSFARSIGEFGATIAFAGSIQDIAIDAFRIEYAHISDQGNLAASYQLGYRLAIIAATSIALILSLIHI